MKAWTRWQDWVALVAGLYAALAVIWTTPRTTASVTLMIVFGVLMIAAALWSLGAPKSVSMETILTVLSALLFVSPWMGEYSSLAGPAWTSWIAGIVGVIVALWGFQPEIAAHRSMHGGATPTHA